MDSPHVHPHPFIAYLISMLMYIFSFSLAEIDQLSGLILKLVSIFAFLVTTGYTIWKWVSEKKKHDRTMEILSDKKNEHKSTENKG